MVNSVYKPHTHTHTGGIGSINMYLGCQRAFLMRRGWGLPRIPGGPVYHGAHRITVPCSLCMAQRPRFFGCFEQGRACAWTHYSHFGPTLPLVSPGRRCKDKANISAALWSLLVETGQCCVLLFVSLVILAWPRFRTPGPLVLGSQFQISKY